MVYDPDDTIAAIGTASGGASRGMIRLSGPRVFECLEACFETPNSKQSLSETRSPNLLSGSFKVANQESACIHCDLFLWPTNRSYTHQPTAELHTIGSPPLLEKMLRSLCDQGARLAEPGEFTLRAFLAGRLDLTQAEAVLGVIDAQSSTGLQSALAQLAGGLSLPLSRLREELLQLLAELEAGLDFVEEDIEFITTEQLRQQLTTAQSIVTEVVQQLSSREEADDLARVVLSGPPNAGKSSLFNALVDRYANSSTGQQALVSEQSGTTRDFVTAVLRIDDIECELIDTAGVESNLPKESIGQLAQDATNRQQAQAKLTIRCDDACEADLKKLRVAEATELVALTKSDLASIQTPNSDSHVLCSSIKGTGIVQLAQKIREKLADSALESGNSLSLTATRCADSLHHSQDSLTRALELVEHRGGEELIAAEVREALNSLSQVVGTVYTDDILDRIFGQFCIGK